MHTFKDEAPEKIPFTGVIETCVLNSDLEKGLFYPCGLPLFSMDPQDGTSIEGNGELTKLLSEVPFVFSLSAMSILMDSSTSALGNHADIDLIFSACNGFPIPSPAAVWPVAS